MAKNKLPIIQCSLIGSLKYIDIEPLKEEPAVEEDRLELSIAMKFKHKIKPEDVTLVVTRLDELFVDEKILKPVNADRKALVKQQGRGRYLHFKLEDLFCKTAYQYQVFYKNKLLDIPGRAENRVIFQTPPARQDPQPLKIAIGGDQERHEQFNPFGACFDLDNQSDTTLLYQHIGKTGLSEAVKDTDIDAQPYQLFIHLGDLFNGELFFSFRNIFRPGRKFFEHRVESRQAFRHHLNSDFVAPVTNNLAHCIFSAVYDDHDIGNNNAGPPETEKEYRTQKNMVDSFHELVLMEDFLQEDIAKPGPYYSIRIGQTEIFYLHNRYTKDMDSEDSFLLGNEQWDWLENKLNNSRASHKIIVSPLPFVMGKKPEEDYRGHWQEWHRFMQLCRTYRIATILTADSHNYSHSEIHVRSDEYDIPWVVNQHLVGTLGGSKQSITNEEMNSINQAGRPPLLPTHPDFNAALYEGSTVKAYFSPGDKKALIPQPEGMSQWTTNDEWNKHTHAYAGMTFFPPTVSTDLSSEKDKIEEVTEDTKDAHWRVNLHLFTCSKKKHEVDYEPRFEIDYIV